VDRIWTETDKKVAGLDKEKLILPVSREPPAHIKEPRKKGRDVIEC
jgi:hypothetical protein